MSEIDSKALKGALWNYTQQLSTIGVQFIVSIILARILLPSEFGLVGMLAVFIQVANILVQGGLSQSLIRDDAIDEADTSTVFYFNLGVSVLLYAFLYVGAPLVAKFYEQSILIDMLRVLGLVIIINSFGIVQQTLLTRALEFKKQSIIILTAVVVSSVVAIVMAYNGFGVWSLVMQQLSYSIVSTGLFWFSSSFRPAFIFDKNKFESHFNFGIKLTLSGVINTIFDNVYNIIIGKYFAAANLGYYTQSIKLRDLPIRSMSSTLMRVTFPYFSKLKDEEELKSRLRSVVRIALFISSPIMIVLSVFSKEIIELVYTTKWLPAAPYLSLLALAGIFYPLNAFILNVLLVKGRSDTFLKLEIIKKLVIVVTIALTLHHGIIALIIGQIVTVVLFTPLNSYFVSKVIKYSVKEQMFDVLGYVVTAVLIGGIFYLIRGVYFTDMLLPWRLAIYLVLYAISYLSVIKLINPSIFETFQKLYKLSAKRNH